MKAPAAHGSSDGISSMSLGPIAAAAREGIVMIDHEQSIVAANAAALEMFGWERPGLLGQPLSLLIPERFRSRHVTQVRAFDVSGAPEHRVLRREPITGLRRDGTEFPLEATISRVELAGNDGAPRTYFAAVLRDLSAERALQAQVALLTERFRTVFDMSPVAMWIVEDERVCHANRAAAELLGAPDSACIIGKLVYTFLQPEVHAAVQTHLAQVLAHADARPVANAGIVRLDGQTREVEIASAALPDHGRTVVQMVITDITWRQRQIRAQTAHRLALRQLSASVVEAREEERRRIARELHDELGQRLTALKMELSSLKRAGQPDDEMHRVAVMLEMIDDTVGAVRRIAADLRPLMLDDLGLNAAIEALAREASKRLDIEVTVRLGSEDPPLSSSTAIALYRMVQEALTNVGRHARATDVDIQLHTAGSEIVLTIHDNGDGFPAGALQREGRFGLLGMHERAVAMGGRLEVDNPAGGGGRVRVHVPLHKDSAAAATTG